MPEVELDGFDADVQALPGRTQPRDRFPRLAGGAQPAGVRDLQLGQFQWHPQALGAVPGGLERRRARIWWGGWASSRRWCWW